jgi:hypothetical protein
MVSLRPELKVLNYSPDRKIDVRLIQQLIVTSEDDKHVLINVQGVNIIYVDYG